MSHPLHDADKQGEHGKAAQSKANVDEIKHREPFVSDGAKLDLMGVKMPFEFGPNGVKAA